MPGSMRKRRNWIWWGGTPDPQVSQRERRGKLLVRIANADRLNGHQGGTQVDVSDRDVAFLIERGFIAPSRVEVTTSWGGGHALRRTRAKITDAGWEAVWSENLGGAKPLPKSERMERKSHQPRRS